MDVVNRILQFSLFGNTLSMYVFLTLFYLLLLIVLKIVKRTIIKKLEAYIALPSAHPIAVFSGRLIVKHVLPLLYFAAFYMVLIQLNLQPGFARFASGTWILIFAIQMTKVGIAVVMYLIEELWVKRDKQEQTAQTFKSIQNLLRLAIWGMSLVFILDNLGFNIAAVVAGLGIGGIAVALAAQTILGDLFNYFVIFFDKPFEVGDFIMFEDFMGHIENIGIKSTRIRALSGEQIVISNTNLTSAKIRNYKHMTERRVVFSLGIVYEVPLEKLKKVPGMVRSILEKEKEIRIDRIHFKSFGDFSLNIETVYFVLNTDYNFYMDIQQRVNFSIMETFQKEGIEFAYPTSVQYHK